MLRTSEFWIGLATALGQVGVMVGFWSQEHFNGVLLPAIVYIVGRITSKVAKGAVPSVLLLGLLLAPAQLQAQTTPPPAKVFGAYLGANATWNDGSGSVEWEPGMSAKASLSPHISAVGSGDYGVRSRSWRYAGGFRITVTDVDDPTASVGVGMQYYGTDSKGHKPDEFKVDVTLAKHPWPRNYYLKRVILLARGWVGIDSRVPGGLASVRYQLPL